MSWYTRTLALFALVVLGAAGAAAPPKRLLLVGQGPDGHPAGTHEYNAGLKILQKCLAKVPGLEVNVAHGDEPWRDGPELIGRADAVVLFVSEGARWMQHSPQ